MNWKWSNSYLLLGRLEHVRILMHNAQFTKLAQMLILKSFTPSLFDNELFTHSWLSNSNHFSCHIPYTVTLTCDRPVILAKHPSRINTVLIISTVICNIYWLRYYYFYIDTPYIPLSSVNFRCSQTSAPWSFKLLFPAFRRSWPDYPIYGLVSSKNSVSAPKTMLPLTR